MIGLLLGLCFASSVHDVYARQDTTALRGLLAAAAVREDSLLIRYRLYSLTRDRGLIRNLPSDLADGSPRELALLSALWAARIDGSPPWQVIRYGRRSVGLLNRAAAAAPRDPLVILIEGQSLIFRPGIAGGDARRGAQVLRELRASLEADPGCGVPAIEAAVWHWYALRRTGDAAADALRQNLLATGPAPLYREFLEAPP